MKKIRYAIEALTLFLTLIIFKALPAQSASGLGGWIGRTIGPHLAASRKARRNLERALPHLTEPEKNKIITGMWDNLGRIMAEYPHLETLSRDHTTITGAEHLTNALAQGRGAVCFGAHLGNWEINTAACFTQLGISTDLSYRAPNNPWSDRLLMKARSLGGALSAHAKSRAGGKAMMNTIKNGGALGILIDQKYNQGLPVLFFGQAAMTNPFFVQLCQKYRCPLIPVRSKRLGGARFQVTALPPIPVFEADGTTPRPVEDVIEQAHALLEDWIVETPQQWLWLHRRWKDF